MTFSLTSPLCAAALMLGLACAANAQDSAGPHELHGPGGQGGGGGLFISPCGRPFRAEPGAPYPAAVWFAQADSDHDGFLERGEFRADAAAFFAILDSNHDGVIDTGEVKFYEHNIVPEILHGSPEAMGEAKLLLAQYSGGGRGAAGRTGGVYQGAARPSMPRRPLSEMTGAAPYGLLAEPEPVTATDTQFNGRITLAEFLAAADRRFEALDVNGQGRIAMKDLPLTAVQQSQDR